MDNMTLITYVPSPSDFDGLVTTQPQVQAQRENTALILFVPPSQEEIDLHSTVANFCVTYITENIAPTLRETNRIVVDYLLPTPLDMRREGWRDILAAIRQNGQR